MNFYAALRAVQQYRRPLSMSDISCQVNTVIRITVSLIDEIIMCCHIETWTSTKIVIDNIAYRIKFLKHLKLYKL